MKFNIDKSLLESMTNKLGKTLDTNFTNLPILNSVKVAVTQDSVQFAASNGEDTIIVNEGLNDKDETSLIIEDIGEICIPKEAFKVFKKLKKGLVTFEVNADNSVVKITQKRTELVFAAFSGAEYPALQPTTQPTGSFMVPTALLVKIINKTVHSVAEKGSHRPILETINFNMQMNSEKQLAYKTIATDSLRLTRIQSIAKMNAELPIITFNVKGTSMKDICLKTFEKNNENHLYIQVFKNVVLFLQGDLQHGNRGNYTSVIVRQYEENYPDTDRLIPEITEDAINPVMDVEDLYSSLDLISMMDGNKDTVLTVENDVATLKARMIAGSTSKGLQEVSLVVPVSETFTIGFNTRYVKEALTAINAEKVKIQLTQPMKPFLLIPQNKENEDFEHIELVLPLGRI